MEQGWSIWAYSSILVALGVVLEDTPAFAVIFICLSCTVGALAGWESIKGMEKAKALLC